MAQLPGTELVFHEERRITLLTLPLKSSGVIYYAAPDQLARYNELPSTSILLVSPDRIRMVRDGNEEVLPVEAVPGVGALVRGFISVLSGDLDGLRRQHNVVLDVAADCRRWTLRLTPKDDAVRALLERIIITGNGTSIERSELHERNGDSTVTTYEARVMERRYTVNERATVFRLSQGE